MSVYYCDACHMNTTGIKCLNSLCKVGKSNRARQEIVGRDRCYAARKDGFPGFVAVCVDGADKWTSQTVAEWIKNGWRVEATTRAESVVGLAEFSEYRKKQAAIPKPRDPNAETLFDIAGVEAS